ncbi:MAG: hypothetical protein ACRCXY_11450 [Fusobacteriaceae bacterium]
MKDIDSDEEYYGITIEDLYATLKTLDKSINIYFHNLGFDFFFIHKYLDNNKILKRYNKLRPKVPGYEMFRNGNSIYSGAMNIRNNKNKRITIRFKCS